MIDGNAGSATSYADGSVSAEGSYAYRVKAVSPTGVSQWSSYVRADTPAVPTPTPEPTPEPTPQPTPEPDARTHTSADTRAHSRTDTGTRLRRTGRRATCPPRRPMTAAWP